MVSKIFDAVLLDFDDTCVATGPLYDAAIRNFTALVAEETGIDQSVVHAQFDARDRAGIATQGFSAQRFITSMEDTYRTLAGNRRRHSVAQEVTAIAKAVFSTPPEVYPGAHAAVEQLRETHTVILVTKGDKENQRNRLAQTGFAGAFDSVEIVPVKDAALYKAVIDAHVLIPARTWTVGNSVKSDINPAIAHGCRAVWVRTPTWDYEAALLTGHAYEAPSIVEAVEIVQAVTRDGHYRTVS